MPPIHPAPPQRDPRVEGALGGKRVAEVEAMKRKTAAALKGVGVGGLEQGSERWETPDRDCIKWGALSGGLKGTHGRMHNFYK